MNEFAIEWVKGAKYASVTVPSGTALKSKLLRLAENNPNEVRIIKENKDGSLFAHIPVSYVKISPPSYHSMRVAGYVVNDNLIPNHIYYKEEIKK